MARVARPEINRRVREVSELLHVGELLNRRVHELSGGQRQRIALGRAVIRNPAVFLFDEPLSSLDAKLRVEMRVELKKLHERLGATFIYVTHDQVEALTMADRIAVMDAGRIQQYGSPDDVYRRPDNRMVANFLGDPGMNFVAGRMAERNGTHGFQAPEFFLPLPESLYDAVSDPAVTLGIRAESVEIEASSGDGAVNGIVFATEPVGSDLFLDISFDQSSGDSRTLFKVRTQPDRVVKVGETIPLVLPAEKIYLFDSGGRRVFPQ